MSLHGDRIKHLAITLRNKKTPGSHTKVHRAFQEVHRNIPSTVRKAGLTGAKRKAMLTAIALSKARKAGAKIPKR